MAGDLKSNIEIEEVVKDCPDYNSEDASSFAGSKEYWRGVFATESNRDIELHKKFGKLHEDIVNMVVKFCKENGILEANAVKLHISGIYDSVPEGEWVSGTDSVMSLSKCHVDKHGWCLTDEDNFLFHG